MASRWLTIIPSFIWKQRKWTPLWFCSLCSATRWRSIVPEAGGKYRLRQKKWIRNNQLQSCSNTKYRNCFCFKANKGVFYGKNKIPKSVADFGINDLYRNYHHLFCKPVQALSNFLCLFGAWFTYTRGIMRQLLLINTSNGFQWWEWEDTAIELK